MKGKGDAGSQRSGGNNGEDPEQDGATGAASVPPSSSASTGSPSDPSVTRASVATSTLQLDAIRTSSGKGEEVERLQDHLLALQQELQARQRESLELTEQLDEMAASFAESTSGIASLAEAEEQMFRPISDAEVAAVVERYLKSGENGSDVPEHGIPYVMVISGRTQLKMNVSSGLTFGQLFRQVAETWGIAGDLESSYVLCDIEGAVFPPGDFVSKYIHRMPMSNVVLVVRQEQPRMRTLLNFDPVKCKFSLATKGNYELIRVLTPEESQKQRLASQKQSLSRADYGHETNVLVREPVSGVQATLLREMAFTLFFLATYLALLYTRRSVQDVYWLGDAVRSNVLAARFGPGLQYGYSNITRADQIWDFLQGPLPDLIFDGTGPNATHSSDSLIGGVNRVFGAVRMRQLRVAPESCAIPDAVGLKDWSPLGCLAPYSGDARSSATFGDNGTGFNFYDSVGDPLLTEPTTWLVGDLAYYDPSGFYIRLLLDSRQGWDENVQRLKDYGWIDVQTRAIVVAINVFNVNLNIYTACLLLLEVSPAGTVYPRMKLASGELSALETPYQVFGLVLECVLMAMVLSGTVKWVHKIYLWKRAHIPWLHRFLNVWTLIDVSITSLFVTAEVINFVAVIGDPLRSSYDISKTKDFFNLYGIAYWTQQRNILDGCNVLLCCIRMMRFAALDASFRVISRAIRSALAMLPPLLLLFSMTLMGFVLLANQVFGAYLRDFSDLLRSTRRVLLMLLGNVSLSELEDVDRAWTVLLALPVTYIMLFVGFNLLVTVSIVMHRRSMEKEARFFNPNLVPKITFNEFLRVIMSSNIGGAEVKNLAARIRQQAEDDRAGGSDAESEDSESDASAASEVSRAESADEFDGLTGEATGGDTEGTGRNR